MQRLFVVVGHHSTEGTSVSPERIATTVRDNDRYARTNVPVVVVVLFLCFFIYFSFISLLFPLLSFRRSSPRSLKASMPPDLSARPLRPIYGKSTLANVATLPDSTELSIVAPIALNFLASRNIDAVDGVIYESTDTPHPLRFIGSRRIDRCHCSRFNDRIDIFRTIMALAGPSNSVGNDYIYAGL